MPRFLTVAAHSFDAALAMAVQDCLADEAALLLVCRLREQRHMRLPRGAALAGIGALAIAVGFSKSIFAHCAYSAGAATIAVVVPFPSGAASYLIGRLLAESLTRRWKAPAVLENVAGVASTTRIGRVDK